MTTIIYEDGIVRILQSGVEITFRPRDLTHEDRHALTRAIADVASPQTAGAIGFLKEQSRDVRQAAIEEILGVSFPLGMGDE